MFSCTVQKRHYRKGYHISWNDALKTLTGEKADKKHTSPPAGTQLTEVQLVPLDLNNELSASANNNKLIDLKINREKDLINPPDSCGDVLILKNGEEQKVKIFEISDNELKYKRCNNLNGPLYAIKKDQLFLIKYTNGTRELVKREVRTINGIPEETAPVKRKTNSWAIASFVCACLFFLIIPWILAPVFGCIAAYQIDNDRKKYKGRWMAVFGIVVGLIGVLIILSSL